MTIQRDDDLILRIIEDSDEPQQHRHPRHRNPVSDDNLQFEDEFNEMNNNSAGFLPEDNANNALAFSFRSWSNSSSVASLSVIDIFEPSSIDEDLEQQITDILRMSSQTPRRAPRRGRNNNNNNNNDNRSFGGGGDMDQYIPTIREMNDAFGHDSFGINRDRMAGAGTATTTGNPRRPRRWTRRETRAASSSSIDEQQLDYQQEQQQEDNNSFNQSGSISCLDLSTNNNNYNGGSFSSLGGEFAHDSLRLIRRGGGRNNNGESLSGLLCNFNANESQSFDLAKSERGCPDIPETLASA